MPKFDNTYHHVLGQQFYTEILPTPLSETQIFYHNSGLAQELALDENLITGEWAGVFSGEQLLPGMTPLAQVYSGHQFGVWAGQLGDGRGLLLGEQRLENGTKVDWHLKGAGRTPYSRMGDGRCVLRSVIREFLASEAMQGLGIPTTRALTIVTSEQPVWREQIEKGAMLLRVAESHIRFGHFEHFHYQRAPEQVRQLTDYVIHHHWPHLELEKDRYQQWFTDVVKRTARMIAAWQAVGFAHGVMNTDNMSILGVTLDYGPYGFMDGYQPDWVCNHSDHQGRYAFDNQPTIGYWNLHRLAQALTSLLSTEELQQSLSHYEPEIMREYSERMRARLGLITREEEDSGILTGLLTLMHQEQQDYTRTFRLLCEVEQQDTHCRLRDEFIDRPAFDHWFTQYRNRLLREQREDALRQLQMKQVNPIVTLRNYLAHTAIQHAEQNQSEYLARLHQALSNPFSETLDKSEFAALPPDWGKRLSVSCSS